MDAVGGKETAKSGIQGCQWGDGRWPGGVFSAIIKFNAKEPAGPTATASCCGVQLDAAFIPLLWMTAIPNHPRGPGTSAKVGARPPPSELWRICPAIERNHHGLGQAHCPNAVG